jgi:PAS domain S-box-containing protein
MSASAPGPPAQQVAHPHPLRLYRPALVGLFLLTVLIWFFSRSLLSTHFLPHWYCYVGNARLLWTTVIADSLIGLSYVAISATLVWLVRRGGPDLPYKGFFWAFGLFIVSCGSTHFLDVVTVWEPVYWLSAAAKVITAVASIGTAAVLLFAADDIVDFVRTAREAASRRGYERFRALFESAPLGVLSFDPKGRITSWNPGAEKIFGYSEVEVIGKPSPVVPSELLADHRSLLQRSLAGEIITGYETFRLRADGTRIPVSASSAPLYGEHGEFTGTMVVLEDISERTRIERELREKTSILSSVTQALNSFLDTGDWSAASRQLLHFAVQQTQSEYGFLGVVLESSTLRVLAHEGVVWDLKLNRDLYEEKIHQHSTQGHFEVQHEHNLLGAVISKGQTVISNSPKTDPRSGGLLAGHPPLRSFLGVPIVKGKEAVGVIAVANRPGGYTGQELRYLETMSQTTGVLYDNYRQSVTRAALEDQQRRLESQVREAQKMEVLGRLAGGVAHDFNNMLMVLGSSSELLDRALPKDSPARVYVDQIQRTTFKAASITKQLLAFSRKQVLELRPMDVHAALAECESMLPRLLGSDIELAFRHDASHPWILSDPTQIEQVVANLAINSRDAMPHGGRLVISTQNTPHLPADAENGDSSVSNWVVLEVADTGSGMDDKTRAQIFDPFFTTKPLGKGTGLGLSTVYGIIRQSSGRIRVESTAGEGTRFELYFPAVPSESIEKPLHRKEPGIPDIPDDNHATVLLADDEPGLRQATAEILRQSGYTVLEAESSAHAVELAEKHHSPIDVLITDIIMPVMRGPELARRVSQLHPEIRVLFMSGYAEGFPETQLPPSASFLQKPFRFATLLEQLRMVRQKS